MRGPDNSSDFSSGKQSVSKPDRREIVIEGEPLVMSGSGNDLLVGQSDLIRRLREDINKVAGCRTTVLILGETGTGKELVAREIHLKSSRAGRPFVAFNCAAVPKQLIESELFGHVKGAFTGAAETKKGKFMLAHGGSILLDEIGEMKLAMQAKLLRVLQEREVWPVGGTKEIPIDVRVIAATHRDLLRAVKEGDFREDLYYRLNVIELRTPALRERPDDIPLLVSHIAGKVRKGIGLNGSIRFAPDAIDRLCEYPWPGNVRELENVVERLLVMSSSPIITRNDVGAVLPLGADERRRNPADHYLERRLARDREEFEWYRRVLEETKWNLSAAARKLGIKRNTLRSRIKALEERIANRRD